MWLVDSINKPWIMKTKRTCLWHHLGCFTITAYHSGWQGRWEDDYRWGGQNISHQQESSWRLPSPGRSHKTNIWYSWVQTIYQIIFYNHFLLTVSRNNSYTLKFLQYLFCYIYAHINCLVVYKTWLLSATTFVDIMEIIKLFWNQNCLKVLSFNYHANKPWLPCNRFPCSARKLHDWRWALYGFFLHNVKTFCLKWHWDQYII